MFCRMLAKFTNPAGSRIPPTVGEPPGLAAGLPVGNGIGTLLCGLFRLVPTTLFLYLRNQSTPNSSSLFKVSSPITVLSATCGDFTSISSRIFMTFTRTSRLPKTMMVFARWSAIILALPIVTALGAVSTGWVESYSENVRVLPVAVLVCPILYGLVTVGLGVRCGVGPGFGPGGAPAPACCCLPGSANDFTRAWET